MRYRTHYSLAEARALLPELRKWLARLAELREAFETMDRPLREQTTAGWDLGGPPVDRWVRALAEIQSLLAEFYRRDIQIKDLDRGLIDFPSIRDGREVFLCWEQAEEDVRFWHDLDAGYAGREPL